MTNIVNHAGGKGGKKGMGACETDVCGLEEILNTVFKLGDRLRVYFGADLLDEGSFVYAEGCLLVWVTSRGKVQFTHLQGPISVRKAWSTDNRKGNSSDEDESSSIQADEQESSSVESSSSKADEQESSSSKADDRESSSVESSSSKADGQESSSVESSSSKADDKESSSVESSSSKADDQESSNIESSSMLNTDLWTKIYECSYLTDKQRKKDKSSS